MILRHFKLREQPFGVTPDPRFLYASPTHREALASLLYGIESGLGFMTLIAKPGMGKTTLLFETLRRIEDTARTIFLFQTIETPSDLMRALLLELGMEHVEGGMVQMQTQLNELLLAHHANGKRVVVAIDEAQNLSEAVLEALRMLSNFETCSTKLIQIVLSGQLQLAEQLASPSLLQLRQRISIFAYLAPFSEGQTTSYVQHRIGVAGYRRSAPIFDPSAIGLIARNSDGIPRNINNICFNALSLGRALGLQSIGADVVEQVLADLDLSAEAKPALSRRRSFGFALKSASFKKAMTNRKRPLHRLLIVVGASAVTIIFGWLAMEDYRAIKADEPGQAGLIEAATSATGLASKSPTTISKPLQTRLVPGHRGQSLQEICAATLPECRPEVLAEIVSINSSIHNPDHIDVDQRIAIPVGPPGLQAIEKGSGESITNSHKGD